MVEGFSPDNSFSSGPYLDTDNFGQEFAITSQNNRALVTSTQSTPSLRATATFIGTPGSDLIQGRASDDLIRGLGGSDRLLGNGGDDTIRGDQGNDTLLGGSGNDQLIGGSGNNVLEGGGGKDRLKGSSGDDLMNGGGSTDVLKGGGGRDVLDGGGGKDKMKGGGGDDILVTKKRDTANGGAGNDIFWDLGNNSVFVGGSGKDEFHFVTKESSIPLDKISIIKDFKPKEDFIYFSASEVSDFSQLTLALQGSDTLISTENGSRILVQGVSPDQIRERDIRFDTNLSTEVITFNSTTNFSAANSSQNASALTILYSRPVTNKSFSRSNYTLQDTSSDNQRASSTLLDSLSTENFSIKSVSSAGQIAARLTAVPPLSKGDYTLETTATDLDDNTATISQEFTVDIIFVEVNSLLLA